MPLRVIREMESLPGMQAVVQSAPRKGLLGFFGPKAGTVTVQKEDAVCRILAVPPAWKDGDACALELLRQCYMSSLELAVREGCRRISIPLLTEGDPKFPAHVDYKIAVEAIRDFPGSDRLEVFLIACRPDAFRIPRLRMDVERYLSRNYMDAQWEPVAEPMEEFGMRCGMADYGDMASAPQDCYSAPAPMPPCPAPAPMKAARPAPKKSADLRELQRMLDATDAGFSETLLNLIDRAGKKDSEIYSKANVSRQHFSKIRNNPNYKPTKATAIAFAIALELDMAQTEDLIGRAGYTLTNSSKFDVIIMYFIQRRNYDMFAINETLYEFDQNLLGA